MYTWGQSGGVAIQSSQNAAGRVLLVAGAAALGPQLRHWPAAASASQASTQHACQLAQLAVCAHELPQRVDDLKVGCGLWVKVKGAQGVGHGACHPRRRLKLPGDLGHVGVQAQLVPAAEQETGRQGAW